MRFEETEANDCRWSEYAADLLDGWDVVAVRAYVDYQGDAQVIAVKDGQVCTLEWSYGSCSGCDSWEDMSDEDRARDFERCQMVFASVDEFKSWVKMLTDRSEWSGLAQQALQKIG